MDEPWKHLCRRRQTQKTIECVISFIVNVQKRQIHRDRKSAGCLELQEGVENKGKNERERAESERGRSRRRGLGLDYLSVLNPKLMSINGTRK